MPIYSTFKIAASAVMQIFLLGFCGYFIVKRKIISQEALKGMSQLVVGLLFPCFIFLELIENFNFTTYANWWQFPLLSFVITLTGFLVGIIFTKTSSKLNSFKKEFISLVTFQNSGYLPLILAALLLPSGIREQMYVYLFLFLLGFNLIVWSIGVFYLARERESKFQLLSLLSPPVISTIFALLLIALGLNKFIPTLILKPAKMLGNCALPLVMLVVGGNLAQIEIDIKNNFQPIIYLILAKLIFLPLLFLGLIFLIKPAYEIAFLLLIESAVPSATSLSVIMNYYDKKDTFINLGLFWTHLVSLLTLPIFLILFTVLGFSIF